MQDPKAEVPDVGHKILPPWGQTVFARTLACVGYCVLGETAALPLVPIFMGSFYPLLQRSCSAGFQKTCFVLLYLWEEMSLGIFLHCHFEPPLQFTITKFFKVACVSISLEQVPFSLTLLNKSPTQKNSIHSIVIRLILNRGNQRN